MIYIYIPVFFPDSSVDSQVPWHSSSPALRRAARPAAPNPSAAARRERRSAPWRPRKPRRSPASRCDTWAAPDLISKPFEAWENG